jgi:hypothetical protein
MGGGMKAKELDELVWIVVGAERSRRVRKMAKG